MRMRFYGNFFRFEVDISSPEQMNRIINDCRQARKIGDFWISRRVAAVVAPDDSVVYLDKKINKWCKWWLQREVDGNRNSRPSVTDS